MARAAGAAAACTIRKVDAKISATTNGMSKSRRAVARVRDALTKDATDEIKSATEALTQTWHEAASKIYASAGASSQEPSGQEGAKSGDKGGKKDDKGEGAVDADFEVVE